MPVAIFLRTVDYSHSRFLEPTDYANQRSFPYTESKTTILPQISRTHSFTQSINQSIIETICAEEYSAEIPSVSTVKVHFVKYKLILNYQNFKCLCNAFYSSVETKNEIGLEFVIQHVMIGFLETRATF